MLTYTNRVLLIRLFSIAGCLIMSIALTTFSQPVDSVAVNLSIQTSAKPLYKPASLVPPPQQIIEDSTTQGGRATGSNRNVGINSDEYLNGKLCGANAARGKKIWFFAGLPGVCCYGIGVASVVASYVMPSEPPISALIGQSNDYVLGYIEGYKSKIRIQNAKNASAGCLVGTAIMAGFYFLMITSIGM